MIFSLVTAILGILLGARWMELIEFVIDTGFEGNCQRIYRVLPLTCLISCGIGKAEIYGMIDWRIRLFEAVVNLMTKCS